MARFQSRPDRFDFFPKQATVAERRARAAQHGAKLRGPTADGRAPVRIEGTKIASTFWGKAWCQNLEAYSDYANRLPRGRSYVRHGAVLDLKISTGLITAVVSGSDIYQVSVSIRRVEPERWQSIMARAAGRISSVVELLRGKLPDDVLAFVVDRDQGLFPSPRQMSFACSCPDWAGMCKHVAATLYGVGARLDREPELFFRLRGVDQTELVAKAAAGLAAPPAPSVGAPVLAGGDLSEIFGVDIESVPADLTPPARARPRGPARIPVPSTAVAAAATPPPKSRKPAAPRRKSRKPVKAVVLPSLDRMIKALAAALTLRPARKSRSGRR